MSVYAEYRHGMMTREEFLSAVRMETEMDMAAEARNYWRDAEEEDGDDFPVERSEL